MTILCRMSVILTLLLGVALATPLELNYKKVETTAVLSEPNLSCDNLDFLIFVHSKADHFYERNIIRKTWKSVELANKKTFKTIFVVGNPERTFKRILSNYTEEVLDKLNAEVQQHRDILHLDMVDKYMSLSLKHVSAFRWLNESCSTPKFFIKTDDDTFFDIHHFAKYFSDNFDYEKAFYCHVQTNASAQRNGKWNVTHEDYPMDKYPEFCSGLAYVATLPAIKEVLDLSKTHKWLWVDDVFVTGVLGHGAKHFHLNLRYSFNFEELHEWTEEKVLKNYPYIFTHVDTRDEFWGRTILKAWKKLEKIRTGKS